MARYADIDVLLEHLTTSDEGNFRTAITQWLEMHQVEDVEPVVHAHWLKINNPNYSPFDQSSEYYLFCSNCECGHVQMYNFCPSCGAKMDEEVNK